MDTSSDSSTLSEANGDGLSEEYSDILSNGQLLKKTLRSGLGRESRPTHGDFVTIEVEGRLKDNDRIVEPLHTISFLLGDGDVTQALDMGVKLAEKHEEFELVTDARFAYGEQGNPPHIPKNASLVYRVKLLQCDEAPNYATMSADERLEASNAKRLRGNDLYKREDYTMAVNSYAKSITILESGGFDRIELSKKNPAHFEALLTVLNNLAAAQLKIEAFQGAIESCDFVLAYQPNNVKALFRKAKSHMGLGNYCPAMQLFRDALQIEPDSHITLRELSNCKKLWQEEREQSSRMYKRMMGGDDKKGDNKPNSWKKFIKKYAPPLFGVLLVGLAIVIAVYVTNDHDEAANAANNAHNIDQV